MRPLAVDVCRTIDQIRVQMRTLHQVLIFENIPINSIFPHIYDATS